MASILEYIRALYPVNERKDVIAELVQLHDELTQYTLPVFQDVQKGFLGYNFQSKLYQDLAAQLRRHVKFNGSALDLVVQAVTHASANIPFLEAETKRVFSFQFDRSNMTYKRANLLRYIDTLQFYTRYARKLVLHLVAEEARAIGKATPNNWPKAETKWLSENLVHFAGLYSAVAQSDSELKKVFAQVSDATIDDATYATAQQSLGQRAIDPMRLSQLSPTSGNPFFSFGKFRAEMKVKKYHGAKEESQALQLRLQEYREIATDGEVNPKLQKLIQYTEQRIEQLNYRIAKIEEDNRID